MVAVTFLGYVLVCFSCAIVDIQPLGFPPICIALSLACLRYLGKKNKCFAGIGNPPGSMDMKAYLLQKFSNVERHQVHDSFNYTIPYGIPAKSPKLLKL